MGWSAFLIPLFLLIVDAQGLTASRVPSGVLIGGAEAPGGGGAGGGLWDARQLSHAQASTTTNFPTITADENTTYVTVTLDAYDSYGDGWNTNYIKLYYVDPEETPYRLYKYTMDSGYYSQTYFDVGVGTCYVLQPDTSSGSYKYEPSYSLPGCGIYDRNMTVETYFCVDDAGRCSDARDNWGASPLGGWPTADPNGTFVGGDNVTVLLECGAWDVVEVNLLHNGSGTHVFNYSYTWYSQQSTSYVSTTPSGGGYLTYNYWGTQTSWSTSTSEWEGLAAVAGGEGLVEVQCPLNRSIFELRFDLPWVNSSDGYYVHFESTWYGKDGLSPNLWIESACLAGAGEYCLEDAAKSVMPCNWNAENQDEWYYCPNGTYRADCPQGYYCNETNQVEPYICSAGYYCPDKGMSFGYYCDAGTVCTGTGNTEVTNCTAGYYCPGGSEELECEVDYYCPEGVASMKNCSGYNYQVCPSTGMSSPYTCASDTNNDQDDNGNYLCYKEASGVAVTLYCTYENFVDNGNGEYTIDYICECNPGNLYDGTYCETQQSLMTSKVFGAIALALSILLMVTCLACDGVWIVAGALDKRYVHPLVQRIRDNTIKQKQAAADKEANELEDQPTGSPAPSGKAAAYKPPKKSGGGGLWKRGTGKKQSPPLTGGDARVHAPAEEREPDHVEQTNDAAIDAELKQEEMKKADGQEASPQAEEIGQASESEEKETEISGLAVQGIGSEHEVDGESGNTEDVNRVKGGARRSPRVRPQKGIWSEHEVDGENGNTEEVNRVKGGVADDVAAELAAAAAEAAAEGGHGGERAEAAAEKAVASAIDNAEDIAENISDPSAIQEFYTEYVKPILDTLEPWRWFKCLLATFSILFGSACADIAKMIANVFLIVKGLTVAVPDFDTTRMDEIISAFRSFLTSINPDLSWVADVYDWFIDLFASFDIATITMDSLQVTCEGSQAPSRLFANVLVVLFVVIIFETHLFPFVNISIQAASRLIRAFLQERKYPMLLVAVATNTARLLEFIFKYIVQLLQGVTAVSVFLPLHANTVICGDFDNQFRYIATALFYVLMLVTGSVLLRTFVWGMPDGVKFRSAQGYLPNWFKLIFCYNETSHHKSDDFYSSKKGQLHHLTEEEQDEVPSLADILVMICVDAKNKNMETLKNYIKTMVWKIVMLVKMTFGIWDEALCKNMRIKQMSNTYDDDPTDEEEYHQDMICLIGQSHCLVWQFAPALVSVSKFMEASHFAPVYTAQSVHVNNFLIDKELPWWSGESIGQKLKSLFSKLKSFVKARFFIWFVNVMKFIFVMLLALAPKATWIAISSIISFPIYISGTIEKLVELGFF